MDLSDGKMLPTKEELDKGPIVLMCTMDDLRMYFPVIRPWLQKGASVDPNFNAVEATELILEGKAQVWVAVWKGQTTGAFCTAVLKDEDGNHILDVHSLGGKDFRRWAPEMARMLRLWCEHMECKKIIFRSRSKAAIRLYKDIGKIDHLGPCPLGSGHELFEVQL